MPFIIKARSTMHKQVWLTWTAKLYHDGSKRKTVRLIIILLYVCIVYVFNLSFNHYCMTFQYVITCLF